MHESFDVSSASGNYPVTVSAGLLGASHNQTLVLADERIISMLSAYDGPTIKVCAEEKSKTLESIAPVIEQMREMGITRGGHMTAVGGGIIQDIATFVASIYMRGISWSYYPTTLLGMVDSCIGGKSSINVGRYKNLVGNFHPPREVVIDLDCIQSLNAQQIVSGLCEAAKICYARGETEFEAYMHEHPGEKLTPRQAHNIIVRSLKAKLWFIEVDEFDQNERLLLNFGHTFGHAIEGATRFAVPHGIAVGVGMLIADDYARAGGLLNQAGQRRVAKLTEHLRQLIGAVPETLVPLADVNFSDLMSRFDSDKKHAADQYRIIVPVDDGRLSRLSIPRNDAARNALTDSFRRTIEKLV